MVGFIYLGLSAKPISIRRLLLLYVVSFVLTRYLVSMMHFGFKTSGPPAIAVAITLMVWISPLVRVAWDSIRSRGLRFEALDSTSVFVRFTYGFALTAMALVVIRSASSEHALTLPALAQITAVAIMIGAGVLLGVRPGGPEPPPHSRAPKTAQNRGHAELRASAA
jgi:hypothetical protein